MELATAVPHLNMHIHTPQRRRSWFHPTVRVPSRHEPMGIPREPRFRKYVTLARIYRHLVFERVRFFGFCYGAITDWSVWFGGMVYVRIRDTG